MRARSLLSGGFGKTLNVALAVAVLLVAAFAARAARLDVVSTAPTQGAARQVAVSGNVAGVVTENPFAVQFFDVTDPTAPVSETTYVPNNPFGVPTDIAMSGQIAFVTYPALTDSSFAGIRALDVTNPSSPIERGRFDLRGNPQDQGVRPDAGPTSIDIRGTTVFITAFQDRVIIVDYSNLDAPAALSLTLPDAGDQVRALGGNRFVTVEGSVTEMFEAKDLRNPILIQIYQQPSFLSHVMGAVGNGNGTRVYIGIGGLGSGNDRALGNGIQRVAFEARGTIPEVRFLNAIYRERPVNAMAVAPFTGTVFAANGADGVRAFSAQLFQELAHTDTAGVAQDVALKGNLVFVADGTGGLVIMKFRP